MSEYIDVREKSIIQQMNMNKFKRQSWHSAEHQKQTQNVKQTEYLGLKSCHQ